MTHLFSMALVLLLIAPQNQDLPDALQKLPDEVSDRATVIVTGTYGRGIGPCIFMPDGTRVRPLEFWFRIKNVYQGQVGGKYIHINGSLPPKNQKVGVELKVDREYLVLLRPNDASMKAIRAGAYVPTRKALYDEEIIAIVALK